MGKNYVIAQAIAANNQDEQEAIGYDTETHKPKATNGPTTDTTVVRYLFDEEV